MSSINPLDLISLIWSWTKGPLPELRFEYNILKSNENLYCQFAHVPDCNSEGLFFRMSVNNFGKNKIEDADIRVEKIEHQDKGKRVQISSSPFFLHWANENSDNSRTIYSRTPVFIDVIYTIETHPNIAYLFPKAKHSVGGIQSSLKPGKYFITIKLLGDNIKPLEKEILIDFDGHWDTLKMSLL